ncbi:MAG TPA: hypothetical protein VEB65_13560 [Solirubrobacterales bacterium]|nr:hypothetical protein [Solirubrobacterales bacterium]
MIGTYVSAALICAASLLVGRALLSLAGRDSWSWLEPAVGFGAVLAVTGLLARAPGHGTSATLGVVILLALAAAVVWRLPYRAPGALASGLAVAIVIGLVLAIPFAISGRYGLLGVGFNNDLGLHLAWAEWLRSGIGPAPDPGYPLGPHGLAVATAAVPGIGLGQAFIGEIVAIGVMTGLTALAALAELRPWKRVFCATLVAVPYLAASYFAQAAFKETAEALFVLGFALFLMAPGSPDGGRWARLRFALPPLAIVGGIFFSYSFAGVAWPAVILVLWSLTLAPVRRALRPRTVLRFLTRPLTLLAILVLAALAFAALFGPFGFRSSFSKVAGSNTYGPVSPLEALGVWPTSNYRLDAAGGAELRGVAGTIAVLALLVGVAWWVWRRQLAVPVALGGCAILYLASLPSSGDYSQAKALIIAAPLAMLVAVKPLLAELGWRSAESDSGAGARAERSEPEGERRRPGAPLLRLAWAVLAVAFCGGAIYSSFLVLRDAPVAPGGHGAELKAFLPILHGEPVLYAGQDRYAAYELLGADTHVPLVEFPDDAVSPNPEKPFDTGDAYSPIDFDSFNHGTLERFPYVITSRAAWNSKAPPGFKRIAVTPDYVLWEKTGEVPEERHVLLEGTEAGARAGCDAPEIRILLAEPGRASLFPDAVIGPKSAWSDGSILGTGESTSQILDLPAGSWNLSIQYFSPVELTLSAPGFSEPLIAALDGQRPNTISLGNNGQYWPAGRFESKGGEVEFTIATADASGLQSLAGYDGKAYVGELVAVPAEPHREVPLAQACDGWIDSYESPASP